MRTRYEYKIFKNRNYNVFKGELIYSFESYEFINLYKCFDNHYLTNSDGSTVGFI